MRTENTTTKRRDYYVEGNAVRRMESVPDYRQIQKERIEKEKEAELRRRKRIARRNQERELRMSRSYVMFLTVAVLVFGIVAGTYIKIQSDMTARLKTISNLKSQIEDLAADNDETVKRINTMIDLDSIRDRAMNELGMSYAKESQIIYYTVGDDDYMNQYGEIPEK